jgi:hypothetical protein
MMEQDMAQPSVRVAGLKAREGEGGGAAGPGGDEEEEEAEEAGTDEVMSQFGTSPMRDYQTQLETQAREETQRPEEAATGASGSGEDGGGWEAPSSPARSVATEVSAVSAGWWCFWLLGEDWCVGWWRDGVCRAWQSTATPPPRSRPDEDEWFEDGRPPRGMDTQGFLTQAMDTQGEGEGLEATQSSLIQTTQVDRDEEEEEEEEEEEQVGKGGAEESKGGRTPPRPRHVTRSTARAQTDQLRSGQGEARPQPVRYQPPAAATQGEGAACVPHTSLLVPPSMHGPTSRGTASLAMSAHGPCVCGMAFAASATRGRTPPPPPAAGVSAASAQRVRVPVATHGAALQDTDDPDIHSMPIFRAARAPSEQRPRSRPAGKTRKSAQRNTFLPRRC